MVWQQVVARTSRGGSDFQVEMITVRARHRFLLALMFLLASVLCSTSMSVTAQEATGTESAAAPDAAIAPQSDSGAMAPILVFSTQSLEKFVEDVKFVGLEGDDDDFIPAVEVLLGEILSQRDRLLGPLAGPGAPPPAAVDEPAADGNAAPADGAKPAAGDAKPAKKPTPRLPLREMPGVDKTRPWGFLVVTDGVMISPVAFVPIVENGLGDTIESLKVVFGESQKLDDGSYQIGTGTLTGVVRESNGWAFIAQTADHLENPPDPLALVGDLNTRYDMALQWNVQNVPEVLRSMLIDQSGGLFDTMFTARPGESGPQFALRHEMAAGGVDLLRRTLAEVDQVTFGMNVDQESHRLLSETVVRPLADSRMKSQIESIRGVQSRFGGILSVSDPILLMNATGPLDDGMVAHMTAELNAYGGAINELIDTSAIVSSDEERTAYKELAAALVEQGKASVATGKLDLAVSITRSAKSKAGALNLVAATTVADSSALEKVFARLVEMSTNDPSVVEAKLAVDEHDGVKIHKLALKPTDELKPFEKLFGGLAIHAAFSEGAAWLAIGPDAVPSLKSAMSEGPVDAKPLRFQAHLQQLVRMLGESIEDSTQRMAISVLGMNLSAGGGDNDLATFVVEPTESGDLRIDGAAGRGVLRTMVVVTPLLGPLLKGGAPGAGGLPF